MERQKGAWFLLPVFVEHGELRVSVHAEPVLSVVNGNQVLDQLVVRLANDATLALVRTKHCVIVERIIDHWKACVEEMQLCQEMCSFYN